MLKKTIQKKVDTVKWLLNQTEKIGNPIVQIGLEYFILKAIDDELELEILNNTITALIKE